MCVVSGSAAQALSHRLRFNPKNDTLLSAAQVRVAVEGVCLGVLWAVQG
jgi:hypothetical protein